MKNYILPSLLFVSLFIFSCTETVSPERLERDSYISEIAGEERDYFVYFPKGYDSQPDKNWPVILFLHGNGERGNGKEELDFTIAHGPLMEAWVQKRDLPFIIISPQLHMFGLDTVGIDYLTDRDPNSIPKRLEIGVPERDANFPSADKLESEAHVTTFDEQPYLMEFGWNRVQNDVIGILDDVIANYNTDSSRVYLSGLSYGGFGTWYIASNYPERFAAINPIVGWGHPSLMPSIAESQLPIWVFAGGRDNVIEKKYFFEGLNVLEELGHQEVLFTIHEDMNHDTWRRVYEGEDIYNWLLSHQKM